MTAILTHAFAAAIAIPVTLIGGPAVTLWCGNLRGGLAVTTISSSLAACNIFPRPTGRKFLALPLAAPLLSTVIAKISSFVCRKLKGDGDLAFSLEMLINTIGITTLLFGGLKKMGCNLWAVGMGSSIGVTMTAFTALLFISSEERSDRRTSRAEAGFLLAFGAGMVSAAGVAGVIQAGKVLSRYI